MPGAMKFLFLNSAGDALKTSTGRNIMAARMNAPNHAGLDGVILGCPGERKVIIDSLMWTL